VDFSTRSHGSYNTNKSEIENHKKYENQSNISRSIDMTDCFDGGDDEDVLQPSSPKIEVY
jgi:hypothetical protein